MAQTVIGLFDNATEAQTAVQALLGKGFNQNDVDVSVRNANDNTSATDSYYTGSSHNSNDGITDAIGSFFGSLFDDSTQANNYSEVARRSNAIVTVHASTPALASTAAEVLDQHGAVDVDERSAQYRNTSGKANNPTGATTTQAHGDVSIPVIEEQLQIGKREVERGGVRLRSRVVEKPVEENLRLREEHVFVNRQAVDRAATEADFNAATKGEFELTEHAEVAVVGKEARVVEEISVGKEVSERTETIRDTVRKTDVEVEKIEDLDKSRTANS